MAKDSAEYYGGDNAYLIGGKLRKHQEGQLYLTENYVIFANEDKDEVSKRWEIVIPLANVTLDWKSEEEKRNTRIEWGGTTINNFGFGSGFLYKSGDSYHLLVPYVDEDGSSQYPRFSISSAASLWAAEIYIKAVKARISNPQPSVSENDIPQTTANCFNCGAKLPIYDMIICAHCVTAFCSVCEKNHSIEREAKFDAKYLGGHKMYPKSTDTEVLIFSDRIEIPRVNLRITYFSMTNIENADEKKISKLRVIGLGLVFVPLAIVGALWKKNHIYTIIEYVDPSDERQVLVLDFEGKLEEAQQMIYDKMVVSHSKKKQLLETEKVKNDTNQDTIASVRDLDDENTYQTHKTSDGDDDPLRILKVRLAKGQITKAEYEEMRKIIESQ